MTDLILFDLDGTLVDHRDAVLTAVGRLIADAPAATLPADRLAQRWWDLERRHMDDYLAGRCSFSEQRRRRLRAFLPLLGTPAPGDDAGLDAWFAEHYLGAYEAAWRVYPDVLPCLEALRALPAAPRTAVLTNGDPYQQRTKLDRFQLLGAGRFDAVLTPAELGHAKPDPACFAAACRDLGATPAGTVYVGDWLEGDALAASNAGLTGIWLDRGVHPVSGRPTLEADRCEPPAPRIETLADLPALMTRLARARPTRCG